MDANDIIGYAMRKAVIWKDDKQTPNSPEYVLKNLIAVVADLETARYICKTLQTRERKRIGRANTRYGIACKGEEFTVYEDRSYEDVAEEIKRMPIDDESKARMLEDLRQMRGS